MAVLIFHSKKRDVQTDQGARSDLAQGINKFLIQSLCLDSDEIIPHPLRKLYPNNPFLTTWSEWVVNNISTLDIREIIINNDHSNNHFNWFNVALNTALASSSDVLKLAARLHGQCEYYSWVAGVNRKWLAGIIRRGLSEEKIFKSREETARMREEYKDMRTYIAGYQPEGSWEEIIELLEESNQDPVVISFSVGDSFPSLGLVLDEGVWETDGEDYNEEWEKLTSDEQWNIAFSALLKREPRHHVELKPEGWEEYCFGDVTAEKLLTFLAQ